MKHALPKLRSQVALLEAFEAKYSPGERGLILMLSAISPGCPEVLFDATRDGAWVRDAFGANDWATESRLESFRFVKMVDGVRVILNRAFETRAEAGIELPAEWVKAVSTI